MALAFDASAFRTTFTTSISWTHTPVGVPRAVVVMITHTATNVDRIGAVTYGGVAMARAIGGFASDSATELGASYLYHLGAGIPTGPQTVNVTVLAGTDPKVAWSLTMTGAADTQIATTATQNGDEVNPNVVLGTSAGYSGIVAAIIFSGLAAPTGLAPGSGYTAIAGSVASGHDFGAQSAAAMRGAKSGANIAAGWTAAIDDVALVASAIQEIPAAVYPPHAFTAVGGY